MKNYGQPFYFLRHGVTDHNQARLVMGQRDIPLNQRGREQARHAARLLSQIGVGAIFTSPLGRAHETAQIVGSHVGVRVEPIESLKERNWGVLEGHGHWEKPWLTTPEGAETLDVFTSRILDGLRVLHQAAAPVLVVAHSGVCRVLRRHLGVDDGEGPVPHGLPLRFEPLAGGGWREVAMEVQVRRPMRSSKS